MLKNEVPSNKEAYNSSMEFFFSAIGLYAQVFCRPITGRLREASRGVRERDFILLGLEIADHECKFGITTTCFERKWPLTACPPWLLESAIGGSKARAETALVDQRACRPAGRCRWR
jgi:hypothetical protein